ncbi:MAG: hypothetical protein EOM26_05400 [Alphaproteobacteria bacterium]|nr:hypothetical protein [Alphaproteobacteria bacterium]
MKNRPLKPFLLGLLAVFVMDARTQACAFHEPVAFKTTSAAFPASGLPIGTEELDSMRGGFVTSNGMVIDFAFSANTLVDGELINQVFLDSAALGADAGALRSIIQLGEGNAAFRGATDMSILPSVLSVVQNNLNDLTIQQLNVLDLSVQNMGNFTRRSIVPEMAFQSTMGLAP